MHGHDQIERRKVSVGLKARYVQETDKNLRNSRATFIVMLQYKILYTEQGTIKQNAVPNIKGFIARVMSLTLFFPSPTSIHCT